MSRAAIFMAGEREVYGRGRGGGSGRVCFRVERGESTLRRVEM